MQTIITHGIFSIDLRSQGPVSCNGACGVDRCKNTVGTRSLHQMWKRSREADHVMLFGMKQRMEVPRVPLIGQTIVLPARFGSVITASSGTSIHSLSTRTRWWPLFDSQSGFRQSKTIRIRAARSLAGPEAVKHMA